MIKKILMKIIDVYQMIPGPWHDYCRHVPTCSNYAKEVIMTHGVIKGLFLSIKRILKCNPFGTFGYDPVPKKEEKGDKKMKKKILIIIGILIALTCLSGCSKNNNQSMMTAYTSVYPVEYILENLYGSNIAIYSIYPDGTNYEKYNLTKKQLSDYSKGDLYVYNGTIKKEKDYAVDLLNKNKKLKVIDASLGMNYTDDIAQSWLNPANYLMMASNIKKGLEEYIDESIELKKIENNYEDLKLSLSEIDAELKMISNNANNKVIVVSSDTFKYLEKYGFTVISLQEGENLTDKVVASVKKMLANKSIHYIFLKDNEEENETIKEFKKNYEFTIVRLNSLSTLSAADRKDKKDYVSIMMDNINSIKLEVNS